MKQFAYTVLIFVLNTLAGLILKINNLKGAKLQMIHLFGGMMKPRKYIEKEENSNTH
jgi:hypothetical protein